MKISLKQKREIEELLFRIDALESAKEYVEYCENELKEKYKKYQKTYK